MSSCSWRRLRTLCAIVIWLGLSASAHGQDRDVSAGSSSGSIRPDVSDVHPSAKRRILNPEKRARLVSEFDSFRGAEMLLNAPSFEALKADYTATLERSSGEPITKILTPLKFLVFKLMARDLSNQTHSVSTDQLAGDIISSYVKTGEFTPIVLSSGFTKSKAKQAEVDALTAIRQSKKSPPKQ